MVEQADIYDCRVAFAAENILRGLAFVIEKYLGWMWMVGRLWFVWFTICKL